MKVNRERFSGLIAAPFTPMNQDGSVNLRLIPEYYKFLKNSQVKGAFICGSTGEGVSLTQQEKKEIASAWVDSAKDDEDFKILLFAGGTCLKDCIELVEYAEELKLHAISATAPFYFKPKNISILANWCKEIASAAPKTLFYYYHIPSFTSVDFLMIDLLKEVDNNIPNFAGIKFTYEDFKDFLTCTLFQDGKYEMLWGRDANLLPALNVGAKAAVGSTYNYLAPFYYKMMNAYENGNLSEAMRIQQKTIDVSTLLSRFGDSIPIRKSYMKFVGLDCGGVRLPHNNITTRNLQLLEMEIEKCDLLKPSSSI